MNDNKKTIFLALFLGFVSLLIFLLLHPFTRYTFEKPQAYAKVEFGDIAYVGKPVFHRGLLFMDRDGTNIYESDIFVPDGEGITLFGERIYELDSGYHNRFYSPVWSPDGRTLGVVFSDKYYESHYPALIRENGEVLSCLQDPYLISYYSIQVIDDQRIAIHLEDPDDPENAHYDSEDYISLYNMEKCMEEAVFYNGKGEREFAVSSKMWLAINEYTEGLCLNVYDEYRNLVYTDRNYRYFYYLSWSKDGTKLAYKTFGTNNDEFYHIHDFDTGETIVLEESIESVSFSPDGEKIITEFIDYPVDQIIVIDLKTMERTVIGEGQDLAWRP